MLLLSASDGKSIAEIPNMLDGFICGIPRLSTGQYTLLFNRLVQYAPVSKKSGISGSGHKVLVVQQTS
jgi:hypothetical protein